MNTDEIKRVLEAALLCSASPLSMTELRRLFDNEFNAELLRPLLDELAGDWNERPVQLVNVASGWRFQSRPEYALFINRLAPEKAPKYSRAVMETLAIVAYRQPVTRGDIEEIRGVSVSSQIIKTLEERGWIDVIGHKEVPGRPALFGTTRQFLDDLGLVSIKELPSIDELVDADTQDMFNQQVVPVSVDNEPESADVGDDSQTLAGADSSGTDQAGEDGDPPAAVAAQASDPEDTGAGESASAETAEVAAAAVMADVEPADVEPAGAEAGQPADIEHEVLTAQPAQAGPEDDPHGAMESPLAVTDAAEAKSPPGESEPADPEMDELSMLAEAAAAIGLQKKHVPEQFADESVDREDEAGEDPASESLESR